MNSELIRALTPAFLAICSVSIFAIAVFGKLSDNAFTQALGVVGTGLGGAAGASMHSSGGNVTAKEIENVGMGDNG
jgi:hypothetical protein